MIIYIVCYQPSLKKPPLKDGFRSLADAKLFVEGLPNTARPDMWGIDEEGDWNYGIYFIRAIRI